MKKENLFIDEPRKIVQFYSKVKIAENGDYYDGFIEHDYDQDKWFAICLTYPTADDWIENNEDWGMCGSGETLLEAVNDLKRNKAYEMYPLMKAFA